MGKVDHCSSFPEKWLSWNKGIISIADCCKLHDSECSTSNFARCLRDKKIVGAMLITVGGAIGCWVKYPMQMIRRL